MALRKCACIDTLYTELDWLDRFQTAKNDGFEAVEFWDWRIRDLDATREAAEKAGIAISGFNGDAELSLIDPAQKTAYKAFLRRSLDAAVRIGARSVTVHSNGLGEGGRVLCPYDDLSDAVKLCTMFDTLKIAAEWAENCGVRINLEPLNVTTDHPGNFLRHTRTAAELVLLKALFALLTRGPTAGFLSLCGGVLSFLVLWGLLHLPASPGEFIFTVSGALAHNIGQLLGASVLLSSAMALGYAPVLLVAGLCVGALSCVLSKALFAAMPKNAPGRVNQYKLFKK